MLNKKSRGDLRGWFDGAATAAERAQQEDLARLEAQRAQIREEAARRQAREIAEHFAQEYGGNGPTYTEYLLGNATYEEYLRGSATRPVRYGPGGAGGRVQVRDSRNIPPTTGTDYRAQQLCFECGSRGSHDKWCSQERPIAPKPKAVDNTDLYKQLSLAHKMIDGMYASMVTQMQHCECREYAGRIHCPTCKEAAEILQLVDEGRLTNKKEK